jgi:hypothetical protein
MRRTPSSRASCALAPMDGEAATIASTPVGQRFIHDDAPLLDSTVHD